MIDKKVKRVLGRNWVLRKDLQCSKPYTISNVNNGIELNISKGLFYLVSVFCNRALSFNELEDYLHNNSINIEIDSLYKISQEYSILEIKKEHEKYKKRLLTFPDFRFEVPVSSTPQSAEVHFTHKCNLKCRHCFQESSPFSNLYEEMSVSSWIKIFKQLEFYNVSDIVLSGGEPLFYKNFNELFREISNYRLRFSILTNGMLINEENIKSLVQPNVSLTISMDGYNSKDHDYIRGKGAFNRITSILEKLKENKASVTLSHTIHKKNYHNIESFMKFALKTGVKSVGFLTIDPLGRAIHNRELLFSPSEINEIDKRIKLLKKEYAGKVRIDYIDPMNVGGNSSDSDIISCAAGTTRIGIDASGFVYPCVMGFGEKELRLGNLQTEDLINIWTSNGNLDVFRGGIKIHEIKECFMCELKNKCSLKNCRLKNYKSNKSLYHRPVGCMAERINV